MAVLKHQRTKTLKVKANDRSSDFVTPNFIYGCLGGCRNTYCYVMRYNYDKVFVNENLEEILQVLNEHAQKLRFPKPPNQVDPVFWTYDIGCSTDISLHWKHYNWLRVFEFFKNHPRIKATFATKYVNEQLLTFNPEEKIRIRFSIMPQKISSIVEPKTTLISERIKAIAVFKRAGYEVHLNFSPIVYYRGWLDDYRELFMEIDREVPDAMKESIKAECIFLTHNEWQHQRNMERGHEESEFYLWTPELQEGKKSQYGSEAVRYKHTIKPKLVERWMALHDELIRWNEIRYIF